MKTPAPPPPSPPAGDELHIAGETILAATPEGTLATIRIPDWIALLRQDDVFNTGMILPDGVRAVVTHPTGRGMVWVTEIPPRVHCCDWIARDSPVDFGADARYDRRSLAFPYQILLTTFGWDVFRGGEGLGLHRRKVELFWRREPLRSLDDALCYPALLNVSRFFTPGDPQFEPHWHDKPLAWLCTQHLTESVDMRDPVLQTRLLAGHRQLLALLFGQAWNRSSEHHSAQGEKGSWYTFSVEQGVDARLANTADWEAASRRDPLWVLDVDWLPVGLSLRRVIDRIFHTTMGLPPAAEIRRAEDLTRLVLQHQQHPASPEDLLLLL